MQIYIYKYYIKNSLYLYYHYNNVLYYCLLIVCNKSTFFCDYLFKIVNNSIKHLYVLISILDKLMAQTNTCKHGLHCNII